MRSSTQLLRKSADIHHPYRRPILVPEELQNRRIIFHLRIRPLPPLHRHIRLHLLIHLRLHLGQLLRTHPLQMGKIEPQPIRPHIRTLLPHPLPQHAPQRPVQKMGRTVMTLNSSPPFRIQSHLHRTFRLDHTLREVHRYSSRPANRRYHLHLLPVPLDPTRVPHLSSHLRVKGGSFQKDPTLRPSRPHLWQRFGRYLLHLQLFRPLIPREYSRKIRSSLILNLDRCLILGLTSARPLSLHRLFKPRPVHLHPPLSRQQLSQIQRKPIRIVQSKGILTLDHFPTLQRQLVEDR